jgi:hypothetical protein
VARQGRYPEVKFPMITSKQFAVDGGDVRAWFATTAALVTVLAASGGNGTGGGFR